MFLIKGGIVLLNFIYLFMKIMPVKKKVTMLSRQYNEIPLDFLLLKNQIEKNHDEYKVVIKAKRLDKNIKSLLVYCLMIFNQMYHIVTSEVVVLDTYCIAVSVLKQRKSLKVIQIWHAVGAFKKFGYSILDKDEGSKSLIAKTMCMHENYSYVCTSSEYCIPFFQEAFHVEKEKVVVFPLPHFDLLRDKVYQRDKKRVIFEKYGKQLNDKKVILYVPTFRKEKADILIPIRDLIQYIDFEKYVFIIKLHPLVKIKISDNHVICDDKFSSTDMLSVADYVISDYSAIIYEAAYLEKPLFFYVYDFDEYYEKRNFYLDYKFDLPGVISKKPDVIINAIENNCFDLQRVKKFSNQFISNPDCSYTKDLETFIFS